MKGMMAAVAALGGLLLLTGCAGGPSPAEASATASAQAQSVFLQMWHEHWPNAKDEDAVAVAKSVCESYRAGTRFTDEVTYLTTVGNGSLTAGDAGTIIGMSTAAYCPEYNARH
jgi:ABC-type glycerol-3-phosphate transport system substrate-binding protein